MWTVVYGVSHGDAGWCREPGVPVGTCGQWCTASPAGTLVGVGSLRVDSDVQHLPWGCWSAGDISL